MTIFESVLQNKDTTNDRATGRKETKDTVTNTVMNERNPGWKVKFFNYQQMDPRVLEMKQISMDVDKLRITRKLHQLVVNVLNLHQSRILWKNVVFRWMGM
uniref:TIP41-like protein n=1 Tax=Caenorhabditis tropicalis TaxID=1561998 RepID=A0A1I7TPF6_9PELO